MKRRWKIDLNYTFYMTAETRRGPTRKEIRSALKTIIKNGAIKENHFEFEQSEEVPLK